MAESGYSGTPLIKKLGIKDGMSIRLVNPPDNYFSLLGSDISARLVKKGPAEFIHLFVTGRKDLEHHFSSLITELPATAIIWISWYKKSANIPTDITEHIIREIVLPAGWVDIKVCAVSELWSGLKIVKRKINR
jgi:hypothetical protein